MCSLVMSLFSRDYMKMEIDLVQLKYEQCFNRFTCVQNSHSAWFLDGRTSILILVQYISDEAYYQFVVILLIKVM